MQEIDLAADSRYISEWRTRGRQQGWPVALELPCAGLSLEDPPPSGTCSSVAHDPPAPQNLPIVTLCSDTRSQWCGQPVLRMRNYSSSAGPTAHRPTWNTQPSQGGRGAVWNSSTIPSHSAILMPFIYLFPKDLQELNTMYFRPALSLDCSPLTRFVPGFIQSQLFSLCSVPKDAHRYRWWGTGLHTSQPPKRKSLSPNPQPWSRVLPITVKAVWTGERTHLESSGIPSRVLALSTLSCVCNHWAALGP